MNTVFLQGLLASFAGNIKSPETRGNFGLELYSVMVFSRGKNALGQLIGCKYAVEFVALNCRFRHCDIIILLGSLGRSNNFIIGSRIVSAKFY